MGKLGHAGAAEERHRQHHGKLFDMIAAWSRGYGAVDPSCSCPEKKKSGIKSGFVPIYVGEDEDQQERFLVKVKHLSHPLMKKLLDLRDEELGFCDHCKLSIPCDVALFRNVLWYIEGKNGHSYEAAAGHEDELLESLNSGCVPHHHSQAD